jgi:hypothetical protein
MSLEEFYYVSQIAASVAVLASLIYLALQTRQTARNQQAQMHATRLQYVRDDVTRLADPAFSGTFRMGLAGDPNLKAEEGWQFVMTAYGLLLSFQEQFHEFHEGMLNKRRWEPSRSTLKRQLSSPGFRAVFHLFRAQLDTQFAAAVDEIIAEAKASPVEQLSFAKWQQLVAAERGASA